MYALQFYANWPKYCNQFSIVFLLFFGCLYSTNVAERNDLRIGNTANGLKQMIQITWYDRMWIELCPIRVAFHTVKCAEKAIIRVTYHIRDVFIDLSMKHAIIWIFWVPSALVFVLFKFLVWFYRVAFILSD